MTIAALLKILSKMSSWVKIVNFADISVIPNCSNLPAKSADEEKKHRKQYEAMVAEAKKKGENKTTVSSL